MKTTPATTRRAVTLFVIVATFMAGYAGVALAHAIGNFTINHFARIEVGRERVAIRFIVDMAEIPALQELQLADSDGDGTTSGAELDNYLARVAPQLASNLLLTVDDAKLTLKPLARTISTPDGNGGLPTLRIECDYEAMLPSAASTRTRQLRFENNNHRERIGWHEIVVGGAAGVAVFDTDAHSTGVTDELKAYPEQLNIAPLDERAARLSFKNGEAPAGAALLAARDTPTTPAAGGNQSEPGSARTLPGDNDSAAAGMLAKSRDRLTELINVKEITPLVALLGLLIAAGLGALHALSPGHGKTVVGAYLVGTRGTPRHAAFLGLTVTVTHTLGVFALGLVTLFAANYVNPERLMPVLALVSGGIVLVIGLSLFVRRLRAALAAKTGGHADHSHAHGGHRHAHDDHHAHDHDHAHSHDHDSTDHAHGHAHAGAFEHSHGGSTHTHMPPGADGSPVTWRSLLALGISGGLLPCPSALVVLLAAITLGRIGYGLALVVAFSIGLAATLTTIGLMFVYAGRFIERPMRASGLTRVLPVLSAAVIACLGGYLCYEALADVGMNLKGGLALLTFAPLSTSTASVLGFGFALGLKHAVEADHLAAVSTIVSERKSLLSSSLVGGLWGVGHTISLLIAGIAVVLLNLRIGERTALGLEFVVALMLIALGINALRKLARGGKLHFHPHAHGTHAHVHPHLHDHAAHDAQPDTHHGLKFGARPLLIGMIHGMAGSAALMLLVLTTISSPATALLYITIFGVGSIGGMMLMSALVGLPVYLAKNRFARANWMVRGLAGVFSLCFGLFMVYEIGFVDGLFR